MKLFKQNILLCLLCLFMTACDSWTIYNRSIFDDTAVERLSYFVEWNSASLINWYIARHPDIDIDTECRVSYGASLLVYAIYNDKYDAAEALLQNGADPNFVCRDGETPLLASWFHNEDGKDNKYILLLLKNGADPNMITRTGDEEFVSPLFEMSTSTFGGKEAVKLLIEKGHADIKSRNLCIALCEDLRVNEYNIMQFACSRKNWDIMWYLIEKQGMGNYLDSLTFDGSETLIGNMESADIPESDGQYTSYKKIKYFYGGVHRQDDSSANLHANK